MANILVVDDEPSICWSFRELLRDDGHAVTIASSAEEAVQAAGRESPDAVFLDVRLPGMSGLDAIPKLRRKIGSAPIIVMTAFGSLKTAVSAVEQGVFEYLPKPFDIDQAVNLLKRALDSRPSDTSKTDTEVVEDGALVGTSLPMQAVFRQLALVASSDAPVLITGESGTGKELAARAIHANSARRNGPLVPVSVAALNPLSVESELFGHVKGAFATAGGDRAGLLELARGGTLLLDEIGDVPVSLQVKLLRAIEQREITPVGDSRPREIDFRIIATTNRRLDELIQAGQFREDLYFRLSVVCIEMPTLRERPDDIPLLSRHFLNLLGEPHASKQFTPNALCELARRAWPGNVRELRNAIEHAAVMSRGDVIDVEQLPAVYRVLGEGKLGDLHFDRELARWCDEQLATLGKESGEGDLYERLLASIEPTMLRIVLTHCEGNRAAASRILGLHRATLRQKLNHYGIDQSDDE